MSETADPIRVLHVDDEPDFADLTATVLERESERFTVETATGADEAIDRLAPEAFDCVVSDYDMPDRNGIEFLEAVREEYPDLPFILFTGKGSEEIASEAISAGVTDYLQKGTGTDQYAVLANRVTNAVERFRAEREAERTQTRLETLISNLPGIVYRCRNERGWPIEQVEGEPEALTGYDAATLESGEVAWGGDVIHPDDREPTWTAVQDALAADEPFEVTYRIRTADGTVKWMWERGRAVDTGDGDVLEGFITDITEREERERDLQRERDRLAAVFDAVPHPITEVRFRDGEPVVQQVNDAFEGVFGYAEERVVDESLDEFIVPEEYREEADRLNQSATDHVSIEREVERVTADGERRTFLFRTSRVTADDDSHWLGTYIDITERKERERELERRNERLDEFASIVSHDLRNPLNVAVGRVELLAQEHDSEHVGVARRALDRMGSLIDDLLTLAREGQAVSDTEVVDLAVVADGCWGTVATGDATLAVETDRSIRADRGSVRQLLENLFRNAVEHGSASSQPEADDAGRASSSEPSVADAPEDAVEHAGPDVTVTVGDTADGFYVADDGPGIPEAERDRVFEPGYSTAESGTGFGLSIVSEVATAHGWSVDVTESEAGGARFEVTGVEFADQ